MKSYIYLILVALTCSSAMAQIDLSSHTWTITLKVVDEQGNPLPAVKTGVGFYTNSIPTSINGTTDTNGTFVASQTVGPSLSGYSFGFSAQKDGYYTTRSEFDLDFKYDPVKWNPTITLVLKKVGRPIPMYARGAQIEVPVVNKPIGFDLMESDWVAPYGKGKQSDIVFESNRRWVSRRDFDSTLKILFPNLGDGLLVASTSSIQGSSGPHIPVTAPLDGYTPELQRELSHTPTGGWKNNSTNQNYYLRIRTVLGENGSVKSALYGKIYGDFTLDPINSKTTWVIFTYYLNSESNSRNTEFDPSQNLFKNLPALQQVKDP